MSIATIPLNFMGHDFIAEVEYQVTYAGHPGTNPSLDYPGDPPEPPEYEVDELILYRDDGSDAPPRFCVSGKLLQHLAYKCETIVDKIFEHIEERDFCDYDDDGMY